MVRWQVATAAGLAAAVVVSALALVVETGRIETDVAERATAALAGEATSWAAVTVSGRDAVLTGAAPSEELRSFAATRLDRVFGVRSVDSSPAGLLPEQAPWVVTLARGEADVRVSGFAPSDPERKRMLARVAAVLPDLAVVDDLRLARGMPGQTFLQALVAATPALGRVTSGELDLGDGHVRLTGVAESNVAYDELRALDPGLPDGYDFSVDVSRPIASPYAIAATLADGRIALSGYAPDPETRERILSAVRGDTDGPQVDDTVDLASGAPVGFGDAAAAAFDFLDLFASARIDVVDDRISLSGVAASPEAWRTLTSHVATFRPSGYVVEADVGLPVVTPYTLTAIRADGKVTVSGFAPSTRAAEDIRRAAEAVAVPGGAVSETTLAAGAPDGFEDAAVFAVRLLDHVSGGTVVIVDRRLDLSGTAKTSGDLLEIDASVAIETPEGFEVETDVRPPVVTPYVWAVERTEDSVILTGHVPSEAVRIAVREATDEAIGDLAVTDRTGLGTGLADDIDLAAVAAFAAAEISLLDEGRVELVDRRLSVTGRTADALAGRSAIDAFDSRLPDGVERGDVEIDAPVPFAFRIERDGGSTRVTGLVPDATALARVRSAFDRSFGAGVDLSLEEEDSLPEGAEAAILGAIRAASLMREGSVAISGTQLSIEGSAYTGRSVERIDTDVIAELPAGFGARADVTPPDAPVPVEAEACRSALAAVLDRRQPDFGADGKLTEESAGAVAELASAMLACRDADLVVEVGSGTAVDAEAAEARGEALIAALVEEGVPEGAVRAAVAGPEGRVTVRVQPKAAAPAIAAPGDVPPVDGTNAAPDVADPARPPVPAQGADEPPAGVAPPADGPAGPEETVE